MLKDFKILHQKLIINSLNYEDKTLYGETHIKILCNSTNPTLYLNSREIRIIKIYQDQQILNYDYFDPETQLDSNDTYLNLDELSYEYGAIIYPSVSSYHKQGQLKINLLNQPDALVNLKIEFCICNFSLISFDTINLNCKNGCFYNYFYTNSGFTLFEQSSKFWFPCLDDISHVTPWEIVIKLRSQNFACDKHNIPLIAIGPGDLQNATKEMSDNNSFLHTFQFMLNTPTPAPYIGIICGHFDMLIDPNMHEITNFCMPGLKMPHMYHSNKQIHRIFEFYEELLSSRFPYTCYKQVFIDDSIGFYNSSGLASFATMSVMDHRLLYGPENAEQIWITRRTQAYGIALQFFGRFITAQSLTEAWLPFGIAGFITDLYVQKVFGFNEYRYMIHKNMEMLCNYETTNTPILLDSTRVLSEHEDCVRSLRHLEKAMDARKSNKPNKPFKPTTLARKEQLELQAKTLRESLCIGDYPSFYNLLPVYYSTEHCEMVLIKAKLFVRMIQHRIGKNKLIQVFNKILTLASTSANGPEPTQENPLAWNNIVISVSSFLKFIYTVTGKDLQSFFDMWVYQAGLVNIHGSYNFSRKKSLLELDIRQDLIGKAYFRYVGPLQVRVQEMDGNFLHTINIEEGNRKYDLPCHSKTKTYRNKKKKVPLCNGDEADIDLTMAFETECPVLWITLDPECLLLGNTGEPGIQQPDYHFQMMLRYERDVISQARAIKVLSGFTSPPTMSFPLFDASNLTLGGAKGFQYLDFLDANQRVFGASIDFKLHHSLNTSMTKTSTIIQTKNLLNEIVEDSTIFILHYHINPHTQSMNNLGVSSPNVSNILKSIGQYQLNLGNTAGGISSSKVRTSSGTGGGGGVNTINEQAKRFYNRHFYRIRIDAAYALAKITNQIVDTYTASGSGSSNVLSQHQQTLLTAFCKLYCNTTNPRMILRPLKEFRSANYDYQAYFLLCHMPLALSSISVANLSSGDFHPGSNISSSLHALNQTMQNYLSNTELQLQQSMAQNSALLNTAMLTGIRTTPEILASLINMATYRDTAGCKFQDDVFRANLLIALANISFPHYSARFPNDVQDNKAVPPPPDIVNICKIIVCALNLEILPHKTSYKYLVTQAGLIALYHLYKQGRILCQQFTKLNERLSIIKSFFKSYFILPSTANAIENDVDMETKSIIKNRPTSNFLDVRLVAFYCWMSLVMDEQSVEDFLWIFSESCLLSPYETRYFKHAVILFLISQCEKLKMFSHQLPDFPNLLWSLMTGNCESLLFSYDNRLRCDLVQLFNALYGKSRSKKSLNNNIANDQNTTVKDTNAINEVIIMDELSSAPIDLTTIEEPKVESHFKSEVLEES